MWWAIPIASALLGGMAKAKNAQREHDLNTVKAGTGLGFSPAEQTNPWADLSTGAMGALGTMQQMELQDALTKKLGGGVDTLAEAKTPEYSPEEEAKKAAARRINDQDPYAYWDMMR